MAQAGKKPKMDFSGKGLFDRLELTPIINASGTMTSLGASRVNGEAMAAAAAMSQRFVSIDELQSHACGTIARCTGSEAGFITSCTAAGVSLGVAASITGSDLHLMERLPDTTGLASKVVMQAGHSVNYGAPIEQAARLAGAEVVMFGYSTEANVYQLESILGHNPDVVAGLYVVSHHTPQEGLVSLGDFAKAFARRKLPVIVDMAAEYDLRISERLGVDYTVYSSHKFLGGTTGGIVAGKKDLVRSAYLQNHGIGRKMKIGKEGIIGAMAALEAWMERDHDADAARQQEILNLWEKELGQAKGLGLRMVADCTGNPITRLEITVDPGLALLHAWELADRLRQDAPRIHVREQFIENQVILLEPCNLDIDEAKEVARRIIEVLKQAKEKADGRAMGFDEYKRAGHEAMMGWPEGFQKK